MSNFKQFLNEAQKPQFKIGTKFIKSGKKNKAIETVIDIHTTKNVKGDVVKIVYVSEKDFAGGKIKDYEVPQSTVARGIVKE